MLTRVQLARYDNGLYENSINVEAELPSGEGGFTIIDVEGLGPVKANVAYSDYAMIDGGVVHSARGDVRNLVIKAGMHPDYADGRTVDQLREELYAHVMTGQEIRVRLFKDGVYVRRINGVVEAVEPVIFSKNPEVSISIICPKPYFITPTTVVTEGLSDDTHNFTYIGNVPWGIEARVNIRTPTSRLRLERLSNTPLEPYQHMTIDGNFQTNQYVTIVTTPGEKEITVRSVANDSVVRRLVTAARIGSNGWPMLRPGLNQLRVSGALPFHVTWDHHVSARYGGF